MYLEGWKHVKTFAYSDSPNEEFMVLRCPKGRNSRMLERRMLNPRQRNQ
jgi:hypothetical protein